MAPIPPRERKNAIEHSVTDAALLREKQPAEAALYLTPAVAQNPKEYRANYYLATALLGTGEFAKAEQSYAAALAINPQSPDAELGLAHALAGRTNVS